MLAEERRVPKKRATYSQGVVCAVKDFLFMVDGKLFTVPEACLVESVQIGQMDAKPHETALAEWLFDTECEQAACKIVSDRIQMRRHGVGSASKVEVVGDVKDVVDKLRGNQLPGPREQG